MPEFCATAFSRPVATSGGSATSSGTACRCMFEPISARLASSCSRNGISPAETPTICFGEMSMYSTLLGRDHRRGRRSNRPMTRSDADLVALGRRVGRGEVPRRDSSSARSFTTSSRQLPVLDLAVRRDEEAVLVDLGVDRRATRSGRCSCLPASRSGRCGRSARCARRAPRSPARLRFKPPGPRADSRRSCVSCDERVRLVDDLRQLAAAEEVLDRRARCSSG